MNRRGFLTGLITTIAAPAIVSINNIMPVRNVLILPDFIPNIDLITRLDIMYGSKFIRSEWCHINNEFVIKQIPNEDIYLNE